MTTIKHHDSTTPANEKDYAQTQPWFIKSLENLIGSKFQLDVCAQKQTAKCAMYYNLDDEDDNALELPWRKLNWCNPPFTNVDAFIEKAVTEASLGNTTAIIMPNNPEVSYVRKAKEYGDTIIEMPFRLKFFKPDGSLFTDKNGKEQSPQFGCLVAMITPIGLIAPTRTFYYDFRIGFK